MNRISTPTRPAAGSPVTLLALLFACAGCKSTASSTQSEMEEDPILERIQAQEDDSIGKALMDIDWEIAQWSSLVLAAATPEDRRKANLLEKDLMRRTRKRESELLEQLESGPTTNRVVAAAALGFTRSESALSPLLAALEDNEPRVVGNALLGLALLERGDTPLGRITELLYNSPDPTIRTMAAYSARSIVQTPEPPQGILEAARQGLVDRSPGVRTQCVLLLAQFGDTESLRTMGDLLFDEERLVSSAAARSLAVIGMEHPEFKGSTARQLADAYSNLDYRSRGSARAALIELSQLDYGDAAEDWQEWARRLP